MLHPRVQAIAHDCVTERANQEIHVSSIVDLVPDPNAEGFDRKLMDAVMLSLSRYRSTGEGVSGRLTSTGSRHHA